MTKEKTSSAIQQTPIEARHGIINGAGRRVLVGSLILAVLGTIFVLIAL